MKKLISSVIFVSCFFYLNAQNVGVGTTTPLERLDVNGNVNVNGTIKVNGVDGTAGQVLMKNNSGTLIWGNPEEYKNFVTFGSGSGSWTVPAGVTKIFVEAWGGGGGGNWYAGGGGGSYICGTIAVTPGTTVGYTVGIEGGGGASNAANGGSSIITYIPSSITFTAQGGFGATFSSSIAFAGAGGPFGAPGTLNYAGINGSAGYPSTTSIVQSSSTAYYEIITGGNGGDAANGGGKGGRGCYYVYNTGTLVAARTAFGTNGSRPGGGGGSGYIGTIGSSGNGNGLAGAVGLVTIRF